jgi:hypothetical protein
MHGEQNVKTTKKVFLRLDGPAFDELLKLVTPTVAKRNTNVREAVTPVSVYPLRYAIWPLEKYF